MLVYRVRHAFFISLPAYRTIEFIFVEEIFYILFVIIKTKFLTDSSDDGVNKCEKACSFHKEQTHENSQIKY